MPSNLTRTHRRWTILAAVFGAAVLLPVSRADAIVSGVPAGVLHPNVGAMLAAWRTPGVQEEWCTGTLVAPRIVLTASHCGVAELGLGPDQVWMSFDPVYVVGVSRLYHGNFVINPEYVAYRGQGGRADPHDVAIIRLDEAPAIQPATLPPAGLLASLDLRDATFTTVGYGNTRIDKTKGPQNIEYSPVRRVATQSFLSLQQQWLFMSANPSTGDGGTCYGDSGGPHFIGDSDQIVSLSITGDTPCRALEATLRLDTDSARRFLAAEGVPLP